MLAGQVVRVGDVVEASPSDAKLLLGIGKAIQAAAQMADAVETIAQPPRFLGQLAASQILAAIEKPESALGKISVPTTLVIRESVLDIT